MAVAVRYDPVEVIEGLFRHDHWDMPKEIIRACMRPNARVAVKACHASSKSFTAADIALYDLIQGADVLVTAPTWVQVEQVLFSHVHAALRQSKIPAAEWGTINQTEIKLPTGEFLLGLSTNEGIRFQGHHAREGAYLRVIFDEAPGVRPDIFEAVEGISAGGDVRHLLLGNPTIASGPFYDIFAGAAPAWSRYTIDAFDTPNLRGLSLPALLALDDDELELSERPYLVTRRWVYDRYREWGEDHPLWDSRVRGRFPTQSDDSLISLAWLESAKAPRELDADGGPIVAGIDVAGPGEDETVLVLRQGEAILDVIPFSTPDARGPVVAELKEWLHDGVERVNVDVAGSGWYFAQHLRDALPESVTIGEINVGERPTSDRAAEKYIRLKDELYWSLRERFRDGVISGLVDQTTISQLAAIRYEHDSRGRVEIESKEKAAKRGVKSPDRAEAVMLAFAPLSGRQVMAAAMGQGMSYTGQRAPSKRPVRGAARMGGRR